VDLIRLSKTKKRISGISMNMPVIYYYLNLIQKYFSGIGFSIFMNKLIEGKPLIIEKYV